MKNRFRRLGVVALIALSVFTFSSVTQPKPAQAVLSGFVCPVIPFVVVGTALAVGSMVGFGFAEEEYMGHWYLESQKSMAISIGLLLAGFVLLDADQGTRIQPVTDRQAQELELTQAEKIEYNQAVASGQMDQIIEQAAVDFGSEQITANRSKEVMANLLDCLTPDAKRGFGKIAHHLVTQYWKKKI